MSQYAVFALNTTDGDLPDMGLETGVYLFASRETAIDWMHDLLHKHGAIEFDGDFWTLGGEVYQSKEEVVVAYQDCLSMTQYFHFYPVHNPGVVVAK